ncbi:MAG: flagellar filament capping protein FliD, partial [Oscillospiraceae bacterium]
INLIKSFQLKYMSFTHPESNLLSSQFFQQMSANFTSNKINAVATAHSTGGSVKIDKIEQLASAATLKGENNVSGDLTGIIDAAAIKALDKNSTVNFDLDGVVKTVTLSAAAVGNYAEGSVEALAQNLTNALSQGFGSGITMKIDGGKLSIGTKAGEGRQITVSSTKEGGVKALSVLGLKDGASNKLNYGVALRDLNFKKGVVGDRFAFKINGVEIKATADESLGTVINRINQSDAGVKISYSNLTDSFTMTRTQTGAGLDIKLEQTEGNILDSLFSAGQSSGVTGVAPKTNPLIGTGAVDATAFKDGGEFKYQLNGKSYTITLDPKADKTDYTQEEVLKKINDVMATQHKLASNGKANVRIEGGATASEPFKIVTEHGYSVAFDAAEAAGDLTKGMGFVEGQKQTSNKDTALSELGLKGKFTLASVYQEQQSDGSWKNTTTAIEVDLDALVAGAKNLGDLTIALNDKIKSFKNPDGSASYANAKVEIDATTGAISISGIDKAADPTQDTSLKILGGTYNPDGTGGTYNPEGSESLKKLFGTDNISMGSKAVGNTVEEGKNAKLTVNGVAIERNTNNFTVEGVDLTIKETSTEAIEIKVTQNTEDFTKGIEGFVNDYNKLIEGLNKQIDAE